MTWGVISTIPTTTTTTTTTSTKWFKLVSECLTIFFGKKNGISVVKSIFFLLKHFSDTEVQPLDEANIARSETIEVTKVQKKRGRPATKNEAARDWTDEEINFLIDIWAQHENLFSTKHRLYFNRDARQKSLKALEETLSSNDIPATVKQITKKLTDLKNYFGAQSRMMEGSRKSGAGADEVFSSSWKFYDSIHFLSDAFTPRKTQCNAIEIETGKTYENAKQPSAKSEKKMLASQKYEIKKDMPTAATALESIAN